MPYVNSVLPLQHQVLDVARACEQNRDDDCHTKSKDDDRRSLKLLDVPPHQTHSTYDAKACEDTQPDSVAVVKSSKDDEEKDGLSVREDLNVLACSCCDKWVDAEEDLNRIEKDCTSETKNLTDK